MQTQAAKHSDASMSMSYATEQFHHQDFMDGTLDLSVAKLGKLSFEEVVTHKSREIDVDELGPNEFHIRDENHRSSLRKRQFPSVITCSVCRQELTHAVMP